MKWLIGIFALCLAVAVAACAPKLPLASGEYVFQHRFAEVGHSTIPSIELIAKIDGNRIVLINKQQSEVFPTGVISEGVIMWHSQSKQWIIAKSDADRNAQDVGGCSDGPNVIDLENRVYWTC